MSSYENEEKISQLLSEFEVYREEINTMIKELEELKATIMKLIPERLDNRYVRLYEEKVKSMTDFYKTRLEMRKEKIKSVKDEIDLRRKVEGGEDALEDLINKIDIRDLSAKAEKMNKDKNNLREVVEKKEKGESKEWKEDTVAVQ